jgi:hypothetical protein
MATVSVNILPRDHEVKRSQQPAGVQPSCALGSPAAVRSILSILRLRFGYAYALGLRRGEGCTISDGSGGTTGTAHPHKLKWRAMLPSRTLPMQGNGGK